VLSLRKNTYFSYIHQIGSQIHAGLLETQFLTDIVPVRILMLYAKIEPTKTILFGVKKRWYRQKIR
jgi:hypothetical protein